jgi:hypothetical protein
MIDTDLAIDLRARGLPWHAVATECGSTEHLVRNALAAVGYTRDKRYQSLIRRRKGLLTVCELGRIKRLKAAGATWKELGRITGIDHGVLERYVKRHTV